MKLLSIMTAIAVIALSTGCRKEPVAIIAADKTSVEINDKIRFSNTSKDGESYKWEFGDGGSSSEKSPSHTYSKAGTYNVAMTAFSKKGKKSDKTYLSIVVKNINEKFVGTYNVSENCSSIGSDSYSMTVSTNGATYITISSFLGGNATVTGTISDNNVTLNPQSGIADRTGYYWDLDSGSGTLNGNTLTLSYQIDDILYSNNYGFVNCSSTSTK